MIIKNNKGIITVDYLFSMVLVMGFSFIVFALSLTLTMAEVVQYITFSSARSFYSANLDEGTQGAAGFNKYQELIESPVLVPLLSGGWFELENIIVGKNIQQLPQFADYQQESPDKNLFHGTAVYFTSKVLDFSIPFYGGTADDELRGQESFGSWVGSYLGREVTEQECMFFYRSRFAAIQNIYPDAPQFNEVDMGPDNGC